MNGKTPANSIPLRQKGFGLIEILCTLGIIGILASFAVPSYSTYVTRTKVLEAVHLVIRAEHALIEYHNKHGEFVTNYGDWSQRNNDIGLNDIDSYSSDIISRMWVGSTGIPGKDDTSAHIVVELQDSLGVSSNTKTARLFGILEFENGNYNFICGPTSGAKWATNIEPEYLPAKCQN